MQCFRRGQRKVGSTIGDLMSALAVRSRRRGMRQTNRWCPQLLVTIGASALGLVWIAGPGWAQSVQDQKQDIQNRLERLKQALEKRTPAMLERERAVAPLSGQVDRLLRQTVAAEKKVPQKIALPPPPRIVVPPVVFEEEDAFERLRKNQRALTDQRIGDIIILRGNQ